MVLDGVNTCKNNIKYIFELYKFEITRDDFKKETPGKADQKPISCIAEPATFVPNLPLRSFPHHLSKVPCSRREFGVTEVVAWIGDLLIPRIDHPQLHNSLRDTRKERPVLRTYHITSHDVTTLLWTLNLCIKQASTQAWQLWDLLKLAYNQNPTRQKTTQVPADAVDHTWTLKCPLNFAMFIYKCCLIILPNLI